MLLHKGWEVSPDTGACSIEIEKEELYLQINNLRATLFDNQPLSSDHSFAFLAAFIPILHCVCSALYVRESPPPS